MTAEDARLITQRAILVRYIKAIDELVFSSADRGDYTVEYVYKVNGYTRDMDSFLADSLVEHYTKNGFKCLMKSKSTLTLCWKESTENSEDDTKTETDEDTTPNSPQIIN